MATTEDIKNFIAMMDALGYQPKKSLSMAELFKVTLRDISFAVSLEDAELTIQAFVILAKCWKEIENYYKKNPRLFKEYPYVGMRRIRLLDEEEEEHLHGTFTLTNAMALQPLEMSVVNVLGKDKVLAMVYEEKKKAIAMEEGPYRLRFSPDSKRRMALYDKKEKKLCDLYLKNKNELVLEHNLTPYILYYDKHEQIVEIHKKSHIDSLKNGEKPKWEDSYGDIEWLMMKDDIFKDFGVSRINIFQIGDIEMFLTFAAAPIYIEGRFKGKIKI